MTVVDNNPFAPALSSRSHFRTALWTNVLIRSCGEVLFPLFVFMIPVIIYLISEYVEPTNLCMIMALPYVWKLYRFLHRTYIDAALQYLEYLDEQTLLPTQAQQQQQHGGTDEDKDKDE